jgi:tetratricopeptide (TPR) repeat protein
MLSSNDRLEHLLELGRRESKDGNSVRAAEAFEEACAIEPQKIGICLELVRELRASGRLDQAETLLTNLLDLNPREFGALIERGLLRSQRGDHKGAADAFAAASAVEPHHVGVRLELVRQLRTLDRLDEADSLITDLLHQEPTPFGAWIDRGHLRRKRGDHTGAAEAFEAAAAVDPNPSAFGWNGCVNCGRWIASTRPRCSSMISSAMTQTNSAP